MSTKTIKQRIALVAVSALTAGLFTVVSTPAANAAALAADGIDILSTSAGTPGVCTVDTDKEIATVSTTNAGVVIGMAAAGDVEGYLSISGPARFTTWTAMVDSDSNSTVTFGADQSSVTFSAIDSADRLSFTLVPTGVGTIVVTARATSSTGSAVDALVINVVSACASGALSLSSSLFAAVTATNAVTGGTFSASLDNDGATTVASGSQGYIRMVLRDAYNVELAASALIATVTGANCRVGLFAAAAATSNYALASGAGTSAVAADSGFADVVAVQQVSSSAPATCTATVTFGGATVGSKTFKFRGVPSIVTVSDVTIGRTSGKGYYRVSVTDSAGNPLPGVVISSDSTETNNAKTLLSGLISAVQGQSGLRTSSAADATLGKTLAVTGTAVAADSTSADGLGYFSCSTGGTGMITVRALVSSATSTYATSAPFAIACGGALDKWTVSMDKATYAPGEIATLTLSGKDSDGFPVSTFTLLTDVVTSFGGMTAVTAPTNNDAFTSGAGIKTYQFSVGTSEGSFVGTFKTTGTTDSAAKTVQYKVAGPASTSNADVLKAIVSLIASINKQIAALQKALLRR
jgi:hypothetical protein